MTSKFEALKEGVREKLLNAGMEEFSILGRKRSSLNKILQTAKVSKGVFYHYFEDKDDFFEEMIRYSGKYILTHLEDNRILSETDFIERLIKAMLLKYELFIQYEHFTEFLKKIFSEYPPERVSELLQHDGSFSMRVISENIDYSMFNDQENIDSTKSVIGRFINQLSTEVYVFFKDMTKEQVSEFYHKETRHLRTMLYKEEYHD
jgi:AcrR family transcriptional regulator